MSRDLLALWPEKDSRLVTLSESIEAGLPARGEELRVEIEPITKLFAQNAPLPPLLAV